MQTIWKFPMQCTDKQVLALPKGAKVLCVQTQNESPCLWVVNPDVEVTTTEERTFTIYGTGNQHESIGGVYVGTFQLQDGLLVYHVFESGTPREQPLEYVCPRCDGDGYLDHDDNSSILCTLCNGTGKLPVKSFKS